MSLIKQHLKVPRYLELAEQIRGQIVGGEYQPGDRLPSLNEMRAEYGSVQSTVERMYRLLEEEGLVVREPRRGTFVAEPKERAKTGVIGVVIDTDFYHRPYYARIMHGMQQVAQREKMELLLLHETSVVQWARADGVLLLSPLEGTSPNVPPTMPQVAVLIPEPEVPSVGIDDFGCLRDATHYLLALGHRRIAYLVADSSLPNDRLRGYHAAMRAADVEVSSQWIRPMMDREEISEAPFLYHSGRASMRKWIQDGWRNLGCTALLAQNDEAAVGAIEELQEAGFDVPGNVSVVGFDGTEAAEYFRPRLTTIKVPLEEIGAAAAEYLLRQIREGEAIEEHTGAALPAQLKIGDSTAPLRSK